MRFGTLTSVRLRGTWTTALVSAALLLTGCTGSGPEPRETLADGAAPVPASSPATPASDPSSASALTPSDGGGGSSSGGGGPTRAAKPCAAADLTVAVASDPQRSEMGRRAFRITFTNTGAAACTLKGYPQVAATGRGARTPIGEAAEPDESYTPKTERLAPGRSKAAILLAVNIDEHGGPYGDGGTDRCGTAAGDGYVISPPASPKVFWVARSGMLACTTEVHWMRVSPVLTL